MLHKTLESRLDRLGLTPDTPPTPEQWREVLREVSAALTTLEEDRALVQHASRLASEEMRRLTESLEERNRSLRREIERGRRIEAELRAAKEQAEASSHYKQLFLANMSHEIRTPMTAILGFVDLLEADASTPDGKRQHDDAVRTIRRNGEHLLSIINDVLDMSKIEAGQVLIERIETDIAQIVGEVVELMRVKARQKGLELFVEYPTEIPRTVVSDPTRIRQILANLVGNAIKFTHVGRITVRVQTIEPQGVPTIAMDVVDTGIGIAPEHIEGIFDAFSQADVSTARRFGGSGLGLRICAALSELLGGRITVASEPGVGTSFRVVLPTGVASDVAMHRPSADGAADHEARQPASPAGEPLRGLRVLIVEDGEDNARLISHYLRRAGAHVEWAANGELGVEAVRAAIDGGGAFDVVLMDMQMPVLDGYGATRALRGAGVGTPIVALTAHAMDGERDRCLAAGCNDYLTKPIDRRRLVAAVEAWSSLQRRRDDAA